MAFIYNKEPLALTRKLRDKFAGTIEHGNRYQGSLDSTYTTADEINVSIADTQFGLKCCSPLIH